MENVLEIDQLARWEHYASPLNRELLTDLCLTNSDDDIVFIFTNRNTTNNT